MTINFFRFIKLKIKRAFLFCKRGGLQYLSFSEIFSSWNWLLSNWLKPNSHKKIIWLGPFSPSHSNVGDHAQTLAVKKFLQSHFNDYKIVRIYRDNITLPKLEATVKSLNSEDLIFIHSSGDFGSLHDVKLSNSERMSFPEVRRQLLSMVKSNKIINLPVTAYYEDNDKGRESLRKDQHVFTGDNVTILCREEKSLKNLQEKLTCKSEFFPDFVFYLKPKLKKVKRNGVLLILRNDKEAILSEEQKDYLMKSLKQSFSDIQQKDIMHSNHVIPDFILETYLDKVFEQYQSRELIITDKMHGMITAVITDTPCIALSGGIPHKIKAYESFLSGAVIFVNDVSDISQKIEQLNSIKYTSPDLSSFFDGFRQNLCFRGLNI